MAGDRSAVYKQYPETLAIANGVTAVIAPMPHQIGVILKNVSGGSISIVGASSSFGSTYALSNAYFLPATEVLSVALSGPINILASGSTAIVHVIRLLGAGASV